MVDHNGYTKLIWWGFITSMGVLITIALAWGSQMIRVDETNSARLTMMESLVAAKTTQMDAIAENTKSINNRMEAFMEMISKRDGQIAGIKDTLNGVDVRLVRIEERVKTVK